MFHALIGLMGLLIPFMQLSGSLQRPACFPLEEQNKLEEKILYEGEDNNLFFRILENNKGKIRGEIYCPPLYTPIKVPVIGVLKKNNLGFGLSFSDSEEFASQILGFSAEVNGQRPFTSQKSTRAASKVPENEGEKPKTQFNSLIVPFHHCIECRLLTTNTGEAAQFTQREKLHPKEVEKIASLNICVRFNHQIETTAGGIFFNSPHTLFEPKTNEEIIKVIQLARKYRRKIRVIGSTHSLNPVCHTNDYLISLEKMNRVLEVGSDFCLVEGGCTIRELCTEIEKAGLSLPVLGSICEQTITGAISTGTRGQVPFEGSLASLVTEMEIIDGVGRINNLSLEKSPDELHAAATSLGMMGVVTKVKLRCTPLFLMTEVIRRMKLEEVFLQLDELKKCEKLQMYWNIEGDEVKVVTGYKVNCPLAPEALIGFQTLGNYPHLHSMENFDDTIQRTGKSWEIISVLRWSSDKIERKKREMKKLGYGILQSDYAVPEENFIPFLRTVKDYFSKNRNRLNLAKERMVLEIRPVKSDEVWLSPSYRQDIFSVCFHDFNREGLDWPIAGADDFRELENLLKPYKIRPHFGKAHFFNNRDLENVFPKWIDFKLFREKYDPENIFLTDYLFQFFSNEKRVF